jgi:hypothetical protein
MLDQATFVKERGTLTRRGLAVVAVVLIEDLKLLKALEEYLDAKDALAALAEPD